MTDAAANVAAADSAQVLDAQVLDDGWTPLLLSTIAGMSTCLGAAIVFCHPKVRSIDPETGEFVVCKVSGRAVYEERRVVSPDTMAFSLALAGSVMLTVSVISIGPECLLDPRYEAGQHNDAAAQSNEAAYEFASGAQTGDEAGLSSGGGGHGKMMPLFSYLFLQRLVSFGLGCLLYALLRKAFPEPDELEVELFETIGPAGGKGGKASGKGGKGGSMSDKKQDSDRELLIDNGDEDGGLTNGAAADVELAELGRRGCCGSPNGSPRNRGNKALRKRSDSDLDVEMEKLLKTDVSSADTNAPTSRRGTEEQQQQLKQQQHDDGYDAKSKNGTNKIISAPSSSNGAVLRSKPSFRSWASGEDLGTKDQRRAWRVAMLLFVSLLCHNFPEGLAVAASALESDKLGITVTIGIMIHNIPEGIAIAVPCLAARPESPWLSFLLASFSGLAEPFGAFVALGFLRGYDVKSTLGSSGGDAGAAGATAQEDDEEGGVFMSLENVLAFVAGIMITVALVELFPEARRHVSTTKSYLYGGTISGVVVMVLTELGT